LSPDRSNLILHLHDRLSARGGADRYLVGILGELQGYTATRLLVGRDDRSLPEQEKVKIGPWRHIKGLTRSGLSRRGAKAAQRRLKNALAQWKPRVVHLHNIMDPALLDIASSTGSSIITIQDHRFFCPGVGKLKLDGSICRDPLGKGCLACFDDAGYGARLLALTRARLKAVAKMQMVLVLSRYMAHELSRA
jgi:hypothetical protein